MPQSDALATMLNLQAQDPALSPHLRSYDGGGRRNSARVASLRSLLKIPGPDVGDISQSDYEDASNDLVSQLLAQTQAEGIAKAYPEQVKGEYGLRTEDVKGRYGVEAARAKATSAEEDKAAARTFTAGQNELNRQSRAETAAARDVAMGQRGAANNEAVLDRQRELQTTPLRPKADTGWHPLDALFGKSQATPAPAAGGRMTKPMRNGGTAYSDDGGKTWFTD